MSHSLFAGRTLVIATMHQKEQVIAPLVEEQLGVKCIVLKDFDTDRFGTFSGEVPRKKSPLETARDKCMAAMELSGCTLAIASEGSFGPHPKVFYGPVNEEVLLFMDRTHQLEIKALEISMGTNFSHWDVSTPEELNSFARCAGFPEHRLILAAGKQIWKGIGSEEELMDCYTRAMSGGASTVRVSTDMRAMYNPRRMQVIKTATKRLIDNILSDCPACKHLGFVVTSFEPGLPCALCKSPTQSILCAVRQCNHCGHVIREFFPFMKDREDPEYCDICNP